MLGLKGSWNTQIISDSEEDKPCVRKAGKVASREVVEISSSDSSDEDHSVKPGSQKKAVGTWCYKSRGQRTDGGMLAVKTTPAASPKKGYGANYMRSRVIESSDSEVDEKPSRFSTNSVRLSEITRTKIGEEELPTGHKRIPKFLFLKKQTSSMIVEVSTDSDNDDAILVFDEPKSARKPMCLLPSHPSVTVEGSGTPISTRPKSRDIFGSLKPNSHAEPESERPPATAVPGRSSPKKPSGTGTPRNTSKKRKEDHQAKLYTYAASLFDELNRKVFKNALPEDTKLNWNKRLLTTAGRAKWHRSRDGVQTSEIELSEKILTSCERIGNTLSHEMCHLAAWVIDKEIKEAHGKFWKAWTRRVMAEYPDIDISTRHDYEIEYPYKWKCAKCDKIYGRFSKSIKPDECLCGACREGRLIPQFTTNSRTPKTPTMSRMAAAKAQGSPYTPTRRGSALPATSEEIILISSDSDDDTSEPHCICEMASDSDSETEVLAMTLTATSIAAS